MGIRYYAYAFDADMTERAQADPRSFISDDPLADAWGMPHGARIAVTNFKQSVPESEMLYLDKAWSSLQAITRPTSMADPPRPAHRMFEGQVTMHERGWHPWVRALSPRDVIEIAGDLKALEGMLCADAVADCDDRYVLSYLGRAVVFVSGLVATGRGFAYMIG